MTERLKIIIFDGSFKTTPFINRLIRGLSGKHTIYLLGFNESVSNRLEHVVYVPLGSNQNRFKFIYTCFAWSIKSKNNSIVKTLKYLLRGERKLLQQQNLDAAIKQIDPDIIHLQWPSVMPWFESELNAQKIPIILSQRGFHSNVRPFVDNENFEYLKKWYPKLMGFHSVSKAISAKGDLIYTSTKKIDKVVYTGLPLAGIEFLEEYKKETVFSILSVGRAHWIKGYDYALKSCKLLKDTGVNFKYTIVGAGGDEELQFLIHDLDLQDCVTLIGRIPQEEVFDYIRSSSVLLMPSLEEGIPNIVVEAMALGVPVISTECGGVSELITHGKEGWLAPTRDSLAISSALQRFLQLPLEDIDVIRKAARKKVEAQHNENQMVGGMEALYFDVIAAALP